MAGGLMHRPRGETSWEEAMQQIERNRKDPMLSHPPDVGLFAINQATLTKLELRLGPLYARQRLAIDSGKGSIFSTWRTGTRFMPLFELR
jgi:hypothetical protein